MSGSELTPELKEQQAELKQIVESHDHIVFFGGAGVSTESGIPDFRSSNGIFTTSGLKNPEEIVSHSFFMAHPAEFYDFYRKTMVPADAKPNAAHLKLAQLEREGKLDAVITQNIDGLHQKAGSKNVFELHGTVSRNYCMDCGAEYSTDFIMATDGVPKCTKCGGIVRPAVVMYEEALDPDVIEGSISAISKAEVLIVAGTSMVVYPAAGFIDYFRGDKLVIINKSPTPRDRDADLLIAGPVGQIMDW
ncbi:MAG: NAD-dependent protein deacylase [Coriobacteriales bacterium]|jgi:NAD-dependent deacetylase